MTDCWLCLEPIDLDERHINGGHPYAGADEDGWAVVYQSHLDCHAVYRSIVYLETT